MPGLSLAGDFDDGKEPRCEQLLAVCRLRGDLEREQARWAWRSAHLAVDANDRARERVGLTRLESENVDRSAGGTVRVFQSPGQRPPGDVAACDVAAGSVPGR